MHCPRCLVEYREGFTVCADCGAALAEGPVPSGRRNDVELVTVLESDDRFALGLATASLEDAGIEYVVTCEEHGRHPAFPTAFPIGAAPIAMCWCRIQVAPEDQARARELVERFEKPEPAPENHSAANERESGSEETNENARPC